VGGFFGNPNAELMVRWYQLGAFYPFFRGHAHLETARREPWLFGDEATSRIRSAIRARYALLPYLYTLFRHANLDGARPAACLRRSGRGPLQGARVLVPAKTARPFLGDVGFLWAGLGYYRRLSCDSGQERERGPRLGRSSRAQLRA
jgi:hypothetical protein